MAWERCCVGRGLAALRHKSGSRSFTYYSALAIQDRFRDYEHTGTVFGSINKQQFEALMVIEPDDNLVTAFETKQVHLMGKLGVTRQICVRLKRHGIRCCRGWCRGRLSTNDD